MVGYAFSSHIDTALTLDALRVLCPAFSFIPPLAIGAVSVLSPPTKNNRTTLTGPSCYFFIQRGIRTEDPSVKKTCRRHVFSEESPRAGPRAGGESAGLPGKRARKKIHNPKIFLSWRAKPNPSGRAMKGRQNRCRPIFFRFHAGLRAFGSEIRKTVLP